MYYFYKNMYSNIPSIEVNNWEINRLFQIFDNFVLKNENISKKDRNNIPVFNEGTFGEQSNTRLVKNLISKNSIILDCDEHIDLTKLNNLTHYCFSTPSSTHNNLNLRIIMPLKNSYEKKLYKLLLDSLCRNYEFFNNIIKSDNGNLTPTKTNNVPIGKILAKNCNKNGIFIDEMLNLNSENLEKELKYEDFLQKNMKIKDKIAKKTTLSINKDEIIKILNRLNVDNYGYHDWLKVGMGLHNYYNGSDFGFDLWDNWSKKDPKKYTSSENNYYKWSTFSDKENSVTINHLVKLNFENNIKKQMTTETPKETSKETPKEQNNIYVNSYEKICISDFVHVEGIRKIKPLDTYQNFLVITEKYGINGYYDEILKDIVVNFQGKKVKSLNNLITQIKSIYVINGMKITSTGCNEYLNLYLKQNSKNVFKNWVESVVWDGKDRLSLLCNTIETNKNKIEYRNFVIKKWLTQIVHLNCLNDEEQNKQGRLVLVFSSKSEQIGKTLWIRSLLPKTMQNYISQGQGLDVKDDQNKRKSLQNIICELGEISTTFLKSEKEALKAFISSDTDIINIKYVANLERYKRLTSFFATTNDTKFLSNDDENTRYLVIKVKKCNTNHDIDMQQLFAQILHTYREVPIYLTEEEKNIVKSNNSAYTIVNGIAEMFENVFNTNEKDKSQYIYMNCAEIYKKLNIPYTNKNLIILEKYLNKQNYKSVKNKYLVPPFILLNL